MPIPWGCLGTCPGLPEPPTSWGHAGTGHCTVRAASAALSCVYRWFFSSVASTSAGLLCVVIILLYIFINITDPQGRSTCCCSLICFPLGFLTSPSSHILGQNLHSRQVAQLSLGWVNGEAYQSRRVPWCSSLGQGLSVHTSTQQLLKCPGGRFGA